MAKGLRVKISYSRARAWLALVLLWPFRWWPNFYWPAFWRLAGGKIEATD